MLTIDDLRVVEDRTDCAFDKGKLIGGIVKKGLLKGFRISTVIIASIVLTSIFFIAGFIYSSKNHK